MAKNKKLSISMTQQEVFGGWMILILQQFALMELITLGNALLGYPLSGLWCNLLKCIITFAAIIIVFRTYLKRSLAHVGKEFGDFIKAAILGFVALWAATYAMNFITSRFISGFQTVNNQNIYSLISQNAVITFLMVVILVPVIEESLFRGLIFGSLYNKSPWAAYLVSISLFALIHVLNAVGTVSPWMLLVNFLQYLPAGLCLAWAYREGNTVFVPILIHAVNNAIAFYL